MKSTHLKLIAALILAALLSWGGDALFFGHPRQAEKRNVDQLVTFAPAPHLTSSSPISVRSDGNAVGVITLYSILFSSIAEQNRPSSQSGRWEKGSTVRENPHRLPGHGR